jgi:uncharacterized FlaG/YvyC family protein
MDVSAVDRNSQPAPAAVDAVPKEKGAESRDLIQAVKALNGAELLGQDNELMFQRDSDTRHMVIRVVNRKTKEVVSQVPPEYVLHLAEGLSQRGG